MTITHPWGRHRATIKNILQQIKDCWWNLYSEYEITFSKESRYTRENPDDQLDWNKVMGRGTLNWKLQRKEGDYAVWRFIPEENVYHFSTDYQRVNYQKVLPKTWAVLDEEETHQFSTRRWRKLFFPIFAWFGDNNQAAPSKISYELTPVRKTFFSEIFENFRYRK